MPEMKTYTFSDGPLKNFGRFPYDQEVFEWEEDDVTTKDGVELKRYRYAVQPDNTLSVDSETVVKTLAERDADKERIMAVRSEYNLTDMFKADPIEIPEK